MKDLDKHVWNYWFYGLLQISEIFHWLQISCFLNLFVSPSYTFWIIKQSFLKFWNIPEEDFKNLRSFIVSLEQFSLLSNSCNFFQFSFIQHWLSIFCMLGEKIKHNYVLLAAACISDLTTFSRLTRVLWRQWLDPLFNG